VIESVDAVVVSAAMVPMKPSIVMSLMDGVDEELPCGTDGPV
jgi:hypothetical protein